MDHLMGPINGLFIYGSIYSIDENKEILEAERRISDIESKTSSTGN